ncbi:MAG: ABC transporter ATP-binding protein [Gammaproteobacteria bacterium]|nr:ABC transporter ATP-binding protein [Gammaproteobacteria bacterium]
MTEKLAGWRTLWSLLSPGQRRQAGVVFSLMVLVSFFEMLSVGVVLPLAMALVDPGRIEHLPVLRMLWRLPWVHTTGSEGFVVGLALVMLIIVVLKGLFVSYGYRRQFRFVFDLQKDLADRLLRGYLHVPYGYHLMHNSTDLLKNLRGEVPVFADGVLLPAMQVVSESVVGLALLGLLLFVSAGLTLVVGGVLGVTFLTIFRLTRGRNERLGQARQVAMSLMFRHAADALGAVKDLTVLGRQGRLIQAHEEASALYSEASAAHMSTLHVPRIMIEFLAFTGLIAILLYSEMVLRQPQAAVPLMAMYAMAAFRLIPSLTRILAAAMSVRYNRRTVAILAAALADVRQPELAVDRRETLPFERDVRLENVSFRYPGASVRALDHIDMCIGRGETVGFVGPSGAGKSTLADIVLGLLCGQEGRVLVDGVPLDATTLAAWRRQIGYVPQSIYLADDSIAANVAFGIPDADIDRAVVWRALEAAQLGDYVRSLPKGLDTEVGDRGVRLSGGQRQRLGIARALYHNPDVLILDEATAALDGLTERDITCAVEQLSGTKTVIIIAHRLGTLEKCDRVYLIERGRLIDTGTLAELSGRHRFFAQPPVQTAVS